MLDNWKPRAAVRIMFQPEVTQIVRLYVSCSRVSAVFVSVLASNLGFRVRAGPLPTEHYYRLKSRAAGQVALALGAGPGAGQAGTSWLERRRVQICTGRSLRLKLTVSDLGGS